MQMNVKAKLAGLAAIMLAIGFVMFAPTTARAVQSAAPTCPYQVSWHAGDKFIAGDNDKIAVTFGGIPPHEGIQWLPNVDGVVICLASGLDTDGPWSNASPTGGRHVPTGSMVSWAITAKNAGTPTTTTLPKSSTTSIPSTTSTTHARPTTRVAPAPTPATTGRLAATGSSTAEPLVVALCLLVLGAAAVVLARRRA